MSNVTFDRSTVSQRKTYEWYKRFRDGREFVEDDKRPPRSLGTSTTAIALEEKIIIVERRKIIIT